MYARDHISYRNILVIQSCRDEGCTGKGDVLEGQANCIRLPKYGLAAASECRGHCVCLLI